jgi:hypothetical protein
VPRAAALLLVDDAGLAQDAEVMAGRRLGHRQTEAAARAPVGIGRQCAHDLQADGVAQSGEDVGERGLGVGGGHVLSVPGIGQMV